MSTRKVCVASSAGNAIKLEAFEGTTWGELKPLVANVLVGEYEAVVKPGNITLRGDDSILPEGDLRVFIIPKKNKAGLSEAAAKTLGKEIAEAIVKGAQLATEDETNALKADIIEVIESHFGVTLENVVGCEECDEAIKEARALAGR